MTGEIRVLIADDHALVRRALCDRLQREADFVVVGQVSSAAEAVTMAIDSRPDIVLMDIDMFGLDCFDAVRRIRSIRPATGVVFLTSSLCDRHIDQALAVNASGFLTKRDPPERIVEAIREVASGATYLSEDVLSRIVIDEGKTRSGPVSQSRLSKLTRREFEVLRYIASGMAQKKIAATMSVSAKTVDNHCTNLMNKLDIHDRVELTRFAIREGIAQA